MLPRGVLNKHTIKAELQQEKGGDSEEGRADRSDFDTDTNGQVGDRSYVEELSDPESDDDDVEEDEPFSPPPELELSEPEEDEPPDDDVDVVPVEAEFFPFRT